MKRYILPILLGVIFAVSAVLFFQPAGIERTQQRPFSFTPATSTPTPTPHPLPITLSVPKLNIQAEIEHVGETEDGRMDVPKDWFNVAWYMYGPKPGQRGNSVLAGHLDTPTGPAVFYNLAALEVGDEYSITDEEGKELTFVVVDKQVYADESFPIQTVFGDSDEAMLNLITCQGSWDPVNELYSSRLVVFGRLKS